MASCLLLAGLAGLAALAIGGCGGGGDTAARPAPEPTLGAEAQKALDEISATDRPPDDAADVERLLLDRAQALERHDVASYAATGTGAQRARDRRFARRAVRMSIERIRLAADDLQRSGNRADVKLTMSYRVRGMSRPFLTARRVTVLRTREDWRVSRDGPIAEPLPWEVAAFKTTRAPHVVLLTPPGVAAAELRDGLSAAYREIRRDLPARDLPRRVLVIGARNTAEAERLAGPLARGVVALANVAVDFGPRPAKEVERVLAQRMIVIDSRWRALPAAERQGMLVHEMTHTALDPDTSGRTPPWLAEGVAMFVSGDDRAEEARLRAAGAARSIRLRELCRPNSIIRLSGKEQGAAYAASSGAAEAIVARHGTKALFKVYDAFNDSTIKGRTCVATTDRVLRRTIGMSLAELEAAVAGG